ncbi:MAG: ABC transporter ATP-binding protein [Saprospiraceae bacterium]|nr:ABC transporter ATP-binding protein [Saprospiraceae bacterium]
MKKVLKALMNNPYFNAIKNISSVLDKDQKRRSLIMIFLMIINAILDVLGLATIMVLISGTLEGDALTKDYVSNDNIEQSEFAEMFNESLRSLYLFSSVENVMEFLFLMSIFIFIIFLVKNALGLWISYIQTRYAYNISLRLNKKMFKHYYDLGYLFIQDLSTGKRVYNVVDIPMRFASSYLNPTLQFTTEVLILLIIGIGLFLYEPKAVLLLFVVVIPIFFLIYSFSKTKIKNIGFERNRRAPKNYATVIEAMKGFIDIKLANNENSTLQRYSDSQALLNKTDVIYQGIYAKIHQRTNDIIFGLGILVIFGYASFANVHKEEILVLLGLFGIAAYKVLPSVNRMMNTILTIKNSSFVIEELKVVANQSLNPFSEAEVVPFEKEIQLKNVSFSYPDQNEKVLDNINLSIQKGESLGVIGGSGSGKTTLLKVLLRIVQPSGQFIVDGKTLVSEDDNIGFQKNVGYVEQDVFILNGSLKDNIAFGVSNVDMDLIDVALRDSMLTNFVKSQEDGLEMQLGESGVKLSGGQKQRVGIARALYKQSEILVFDEVTSALDPKTEKAIVESINHLASIGKTVIIVAHRITTLEKCDRIIELKEGKMAKEHSYSKLIEEIK